MRAAQQATGAAASAGRVLAGSPKSAGFLPRCPAGGPLWAQPAGRWACQSLPRRWPSTWRRDPVILRASRHDFPPCSSSGRCLSLGRAGRHAGPHHGRLPGVYRPQIPCGQALGRGPKPSPSTRRHHRRRTQHRVRALQAPIAAWGLWRASRIAQSGPHLGLCATAPSSLAQSSCCRVAGQCKGPGHARLSKRLLVLCDPAMPVHCRPRGSAQRLCLSLLEGDVSWPRSRLAGGHDVHHSL